MDEEKQPKDGMIRKATNAGKQLVKEQAKRVAKQIIKKVIAAIAPYLIKVLAIAAIVVVIVTTLATIMDLIKGNASKDANAFAVKYSSSSSANGSNNSEGEESAEESSSNSIIVDIKNVTENGAYKLTYEFKDENGNLYTEEPLNNIKSDLIKENEKLDLNKFSDSELKIIGALMYNGLMVEDYNEEELKALVLFTKADIASQSFDLRNGEDTDIDMETLRNNDDVYGTLEVHKTKIGTNEEGKVEYKPIKLEYIPYGDETTRRNILLYGCTKG